MSVIVYSTKICPWCDKVKEYLGSKGVTFSAVDVGEDKEAARELVLKTRQMGVPVTHIGSRYVVGYDTKAIDSALKEID